MEVRVEQRGLGLDFVKMQPDRDKNGRRSARLLLFFFITKYIQFWTNILIPRAPNFNLSPTFNTQMRQHIIPKIFHSPFLYAPSSTNFVTNECYNVSFFPFFGDRKKKWFEEIFFSLSLSLLRENENSRRNNLEKIVWMDYNVQNNVENWNVAINFAQI